jgi:hypothetical protein
MTRIYIDNPIENGFTRVPNSLWARKMSIKAKGLFAFLLSFHHGAAPSVCEIETALGIGKDARQAAFRELVGQELAGWRILRNAAGKVVSQEMWISSRPLLLDLLQAVSASDPVQKPENPAAGFSGSVSLKTRQGQPENPALSIKTKKKKGAALPVSRVSVHQVPPVPPKGQARLSSGVVDLSQLSRFERTSIRSDQSISLGDIVVRAGSPLMASLRQALRAQDAGELAGGRL